jgi:hypothetical protein
VKKCAPTSILECAADGLTWQATQCGVATDGKTGLVCVGGPDGPVCKSPHCVANQLSCQGNAVVKCDANGASTTTVTECGSQEICFGSACVPKFCNPGAKSCVDADTLAVCDADGQGLTKSACPLAQACNGGACKAIVCSPGGSVCNGSVSKLCNDKGTGISQATDCALTGKVCGEGKCQTPVCAPATTACQEGLLATCNADGLGWSQQACAAGQKCLGAQCKIIECSPYAIYCKGTQVLKCDGSGTAPALLDDCAKIGKACLDGACVAPK